MTVLLTGGSESHAVSLGMLPLLFSAYSSSLLCMWLYLRIFWFLLLVSLPLRIGVSILEIYCVTEGAISFLSDLND